MRQKLLSAVLVALLAGALGAAPVMAQAPPLLSQPLPKIPSASGDLDVQMVKYVLAPAGEKPTDTAGQPGHAHPGATYAYVIKGEVNSRLGTGPEIHFKAGEAWSEKPGEAHYIANASKTQSAEVLVFFVLPKGAANTAPVAH